MVKNRERALDSFNAILQLMHKNTPNDMKTLNLIQMLRGQLEAAPSARVSFNKSDMSIVLPITTLGGRYNMLLTIALDKVE